MFDFEIVREETFTFTPNDGTPEITIMSGQLRQWLLANAMDKVTKLTFPEGETEDDLIQRHGLELDRMASMTVKEAKEPVILGLHPSGTHILIDGGHRRWFWWKRGKNVLKGWIVPTEVWQQFLMDPLYHIFAVHHADGAMLPQRQKKQCVHDYQPAGKVDRLVIVYRCTKCGDEYEKDVS